MTEEKKVETWNKAKFELWKEYEKIAMHFNDLLIQLRIRALASIGVIAAIAGFVLKTSDESNFKWGALAIVFGCLTIVWIAIYILDICYYNRLLFGAVTTTVKLEDADNQDHFAKIDFSKSLKEYVEKGDIPWNRAVHAFYILILTMLAALTIFSYCQ